MSQYVSIYDPGLCSSVILFMIKNYPTLFLFDIFSIRHSETPRTELLSRYIALSRPLGHEVNRCNYSYWEQSRGKVGKSSLWISHTAVIITWTYVSFVLTWSWTDCSPCPALLPLAKLSGPLWRRLAVPRRPQQDKIDRRTLWHIRLNSRVERFNIKKDIFDWLSPAARSTIG